ncbi:MAG TPA: hypothetical protein VEI81_04615 [Methanoregula sp.]|nr:hypothetical protein [Methanoregula sp.]
MVEKNTDNVLWRQTTVLIRADIFTLAQQQGIDIGRECNRALAARVGIAYQPAPEAAPPGPVIVAPTTVPAPGSGKGRPGKPASAIINADDPLSAKTLKSRKRPAIPVAMGPVAVPQTPAVQSVTVPASVPEGGGKPAGVPGNKGRDPSKKKKEDPVKKFCSTMILRSDLPGDSVAKDQMYEIFGRWCRDHRVSPVPEKRSFSVALKNQFALAEKVVAGTPSWTGVRLK